MPDRPVRIRAVLFDLGGTLVDERDYAGWAQTANDLGVEIDADALAHFFGEVEREVDAAPLGAERDRSFAEFWRRVLTRAAGRDLPEGTLGAFVDRLRSAPPAFRLFSDTRRCLDLLHAEGRRLGIVSNSSGEEAVRRILEQVRILSYFEVTVSSGTEGVAKPDPEIFRRAIARLSVRPEATLYVGNLATTDARAAHAAGLHSIWLNRDGFGFGEDPPEITSLLEVPLVVAELEGRPSPEPAARHGFK